MSEADLETLKACAETACRLAADHEFFSREAVNWADLHCVEAREWRSDAGDHGLAVYIEEASPGSHQLHQYIAEHLRRHGWQNVEVNIEW